MFTIRTNVNPTRTNARRTVIRASVAGALIAPMLLIGASASMASSGTETKSHEVSDAITSDHVTTSVTTSCESEKLAVTVIMNNDGAPRSVRIYVIEVDGAALFEEEAVITAALGRSYEVPAGKQYQVMVTENNGPGTPFHTSYSKTFDATVDGLCKPVPKPTVTTSTDCNIVNAYLHVTITSALDKPDAYEITAFNSKGTAGHTTGVLAPNGTITWTALMTEDITDVVVSTSSKDASWSIGGFAKPTCTDTIDDSSSDEGPKPDTTPTTVPTTKQVPTTTPPVTLPPLTVPPTEVPPTTVPTEPEVVVTTTVATVPATYSIPDPADLGIPVRVLGELVTAQPAVAAQAADPAPLAFTGTDSGLLAAIASAFMIGGGGLVVIARRRPKN